MKQLALFNDVEDAENDSKPITWLELYNFLHRNANDISKFTEMSKFWNQNINIYDMDTGDEHPCDMLILDEEKLMLSINM